MKIDIQELEKQKAELIESLNSAKIAREKKNNSEIIKAKIEEISENAS